jgi:hypothetical protein
MRAESERKRRSATAACSITAPFTMPVTASDGRLYYLQMATDSTDIEVSLQIILRVLLLCTAGALLLALVAGVVFEQVPSSGRH